MDATYGEGNYWYRGQAPGTWADWQSYHHMGGGGGSYFYNSYTGQYKNEAWKTVDYKEVHNNYIISNSFFTFSGKIAQDLIEFFLETGSGYLPSKSEFNASLTAGPGGAIDVAYKIANTLNEFNPIAQLWDVISYAFTGKDRFGNPMSVEQASLKALSVIPVQIGNFGKISPGLQSLFKEGVRSNSIINIRNNLLNNGFKQTLTKNKSGYLFTNEAGDQIRIMLRNEGWEIRIQTQYKNYLNEFGIDPATRSGTHGIQVFSK